jgi:1-acyl-sn-glycerol-3-phosphate acyltransferase
MMVVVVVVVVVVRVRVRVRGATYHLPKQKPSTGYE